MDGEYTALRGADGRPQIKRARGDGWTAAKACVFFEHLCATCNVKLSAAAAGMSHTGAYNKRRIDAAFREAWNGALEQGYARLETMLIARAGGTAGTGAPRTGAPIEFDGGAHVEMTEELDSGLALALIASHRQALHSGIKRVGGAPLAKADIADVQAAIGKQLAVLNRRRGGAG